MFYNYAIDTPANTTEKDPQITVIKTGKGLLETVGIIFPFGSIRLLGVYVRRGRHQVFPVLPSDPLRGNGTEYWFHPNIWMEYDPHQLEVYTFNEDDSYSHKVYIALDFTQQGLFLK